MLLSASVAAGAATTPDAPGTVSVTLAPANSGRLTPGGVLGASLVLENDTAAASAPGRVVLSIGESPLADRAALRGWLGGQTDGVGVTEVAAADPAAVAAGDRESVPLAVAGDDPALTGKPAGVYPLLATTEVDGARLVATSAVVVTGAAPAPVGVVVPITAPLRAAGLATADELAALTAPDGALTAQLDAVEGTSAILAVDPAVPAGIRVLGSAAPASAAAWLTRFEQLSNPRFALQFGDADLAVQLQAGLPAPLAPTSLQGYMNAADFASTGAPQTPETPTPSPTVDAGGVVYPDLPTLTAVGATRDAVFWPATGSAGPDVVAALGAFGTPAAPALTLVPSTSTSAGRDGATVPARADAAGSGLLVYDGEISAALGAASGQTDATARSASLAAASAHLAFATADAGGRPVLVTLDRSGERSRGSLSAAIATASAGAATVTLEVLAAAPAEAVTLEPAAADEQRIADAGSLLVDEALIGPFATMLDDPALLTGRERAEVLQLLGVGWRADAAAAATAMTAHRTATQETLAAVGVPPSQFNLIAFTSEMPLSVRNDLPWPVNLALVAQPDDPRLVVQERTEFRVQASSTTRVQVPVEARLANGTVTVGLQLYSPTGEAVGPTQDVDVEVHAEWENIGLVVLVVLLVLFIGLGVVRTVLHRRARHRAEAARSAAAEAEEAR